MSRFLAGLLLGLACGSCYSPPRMLHVRTAEGMLLLTIDTETGDAVLTREALWLLRVNARLRHR